jgi:hypothetical protein
MKLLTKNSGLLIAAVLLLLLFGTVESTTATTQIVKFGGTLGNAYSPNSFTIMQSGVTIFLSSGRFQTIRCSAALSR